MRDHLSIRASQKAGEPADVIAERKALARHTISTGSPLTTTTLPVLTFRPASSPPVFIRDSSTDNKVDYEFPLAGQQGDLAVPR